MNSCWQSHARLRFCIYAYWEPFEDYRDQGCRVHMERIMFFILLKPSSSQGGKETAGKFEPSFADRGLLDYSNSMIHLRSKWEKVES